MDSAVGRAASKEQIAHEYLFGRLQWLMLLRVVFATVLLGSSILVQFKDSHSLIAPPLLALYALIAAVYVLTFAYIIAFKRVGPSFGFVYIQIGMDSLLATFLIYVTGSIASVFSFLYLVVIVYASILLYKTGSLIMASLCSLQYALMVSLEYYNIPRPFYSTLGFDIHEYEELQVLYKIIMTVLACFLVAFLSSSLAQRTQRTEEKLKAKQKDLEKLEAINASIVYSMDSGLLTLDSAGMITSFNRAAETITGYSKEEALGKTLSNIFPDTVQREASAEASMQKKPYRYDVEFRKKDGTVGYLGFSVASLKEPGGLPIGKLLIFQDLTAFKSLEDHVKRVERLAAIGEMAAGIAHETKNPLASMTGSIQLLKKEVNITPVASKLMDIVLRETDRLNALANDLLLIARPGTYKTEPVELTSAICDTLELFKKDGICKDRITLVQDLSSEVWTEMDPKHTRQILWNLLLNSAQAIEERGTIEVWSGKRDNIVQVTVKDDGCGISEEVISKIFDPFFTSKAHGTGLGLSIVHRLVESYNGWLTVESCQGKGSTFTLYLKEASAPA